MKFGHDKRARNKIRKDTLLEKIYNAYDTREEVFYQTGDTYGEILFKCEKTEWELATVKNMQSWLRTYDQAVKRRNDADFHLNVSDYFQFNNVMEWTNDDM